RPVERPEIDLRCDRRLQARLAPFLSHVEQMPTDSERGEGDLRPVRRPLRKIRRALPRVGELSHTAAVGAYHPELVAAVAIGIEQDLLAIRRPARSAVPRDV